MAMSHCRGRCEFHDARSARDRLSVDRDEGRALVQSSRFPSLMTNPQDILSAERTLLAWIRTGLALMGLGFVVARFGLFLQEFRIAADDALSPAEKSGPIGMVVVGAGIAINLWASVRHHRLVRRLRAGEREVSSVGPVVVGVATGLGGAILIALLQGAFE